MPSDAGDHAIVTGGSRGIGRAIARRLRSNGFRVTSLDVSSPHEIEEGIVDLDCDVSSDSELTRSWTEATELYGVPSAVVVNAGVLWTRWIDDTTPEEWDRVLRVNLTAGFLLARLAVPAMRRQGGGRLVFIGSSAGSNGGISTGGAYAASKAGLMALAKSIARNEGPNNILANVVSPAMIDTAMVSALGDQVTADQIPVRRLGHVDEVAAVVAFLVSPDAGFINGEVVDVNGGFFID